MRLVIDPQQISQVIMVIGSVELPISREQLVDVLFQGEYKLVRSVPLPSAPAPVAPTSKKKKKKPPTSEKDPIPIILRSLRSKPQGIPELKAIVEGSIPGLLKRKGSSYLPGIMNRLFLKGVVRRTGDRGAFIYASGGDAPSEKPEKKAEVPSFQDMVLRALAEFDEPASSGEIQAAVEKRYPSATTSRHSSMTSSSLGTLRKHGHIKRFGTAGAFRYAVKKGWEKALSVDPERLTMNGMKQATPESAVT
jgi:hypothetical protein